ncbi:MAG: N-acetylmuramoyl-L-alanine amidase [Lysobacteraceae bacterium]
MTARWMKGLLLAAGLALGVAQATSARGTGEPMRIEAVPPAQGAEAAVCDGADGQAGPWTLATPEQATPAETSWYVEPDELSLLGDGLDAFFGEGGGLVQAGEEGPIRRLGLLVDGHGVERITWRGLDARGRWSRPRPVETTWSEGHAHVVRIDTGFDAQAIALDATGARIEFLQIHLLTDAPEVPVPARELPPERESSAELLSAVPPGMITRAQWGARNTGSCGGLHSPRFLTIHHTATPNNDSLTPAARMRQMQAFHIDVRGWCDFGYHYTVGIDGRLYQGRVSPDRTGAHVGDWNSNNVGVSVVGNFTDFSPRQTQLDTLESVSRWVVERYNLPRTRDRIRGHRDWPGHTTNACPGARLYPWLNTLVARLNGPVQPPCQNACTAGARRCQGNATQVCGDFNGDGCTTWSASQACGCGEQCDAGSCVRDPDVCCPAVLPGADGLFGDVLPGTWQAQVAERMADLGITAGCSAQPMLFCPDCRLTRAQASVFIARALGVPAPPVQQSLFEDVPADSPYASAIHALYELGVIAGCSSSPRRFCPEANLSRAQAAVVLARAGGLETVASAQPVYPDVPAGHWARPAIETLQRQCLVDGCATSPLAFCPDEGIRRIDFSRVLLDVLGLSAEDGVQAPCCNPQAVAGADSLFVDLPAGTPRTEAARALYGAGVSVGCRAQPRMFCGTCEVDRAQAAQLLFNALELEPVAPTQGRFSDVAPDHPAFVAVETLAAAGIVSGCNGAGTRFCPDQRLTRAQAAALLARGMGLEPPAVPLPSSWSDVSPDDWFGWQVEALHRQCVVEACDAGGGRFCPGANINRGDFGLMLARGLGIGGFADHACQGQWRPPQILQ